jgi:hypothetical protein
MIRYFLFLIALTAVVLATATSAPSDDDVADQVVTEVGVETVVSIVKKLGATDVSVSSLASGGHSVAMRNSGISFLIILTVCDDTSDKCRGLWMIAPFKQPTPPYKLEQFNSFNTSHPFAVASSFDKDTFILARYAITDGGVRIKHFEDSISIFWKMPAKLASHLLPSVEKKDGAEPSSSNTSQDKPLALQFGPDVGAALHAVNENQLPR